jgi:hypothetical protein
MVLTRRLRDPARAQAGPRVIYIAWIDYQRRAESMKQVLGFDIHYVPPAFTAKRWKPLGYFVQMVRTARILQVTRPDMVWIQSPPGFLPHMLLGLRWLMGGFAIVVDGHNGSLTPPWSRFPGVAWAMNHCERVLVHNAEMRPVAEAIGVHPAKIQVLEDPPPVLESRAVPAPDGAPYVLVPCSFDPDEHAQIPVVFEAARLMPEVPFLVTGRRRKAEAAGLTRNVPANVHFTDYLPIEDFEGLLFGAGVVLGVTSRRNCQLSVANEALGAHCALVLTDTPTLRNMFAAAALFAQNTPESLAATLNEGLARRDELRIRSAELKVRRQIDWLDAARRAMPAGWQTQGTSDNHDLG